MDASWLEPAARLSLPCFNLAVGGLLLVRLFRVGFTPRPRSDGRLDRFLFEYVGNIDLRDKHDPEPRAATVDRRTDPHSRELVDWFRGQMGEHGFPPVKEAELLNDVREAIRQNGPAPEGRKSVSAVDDSASGAPLPGDLRGEKG